MQLQEVHIKIQNKLVNNKARIKEKLQEAISKMVQSHAEVVALKHSVKLYLAMLEKADSTISSAKDKETIQSIIDNVWTLLDKAKLQLTEGPTHPSQQELTRTVRTIIMLNLEDWSWSRPTAGTW